VGERSARHRSRVRAMSIGEHGRNRAPWTRPGGLEALAHRPAEIVSGAHHVDLLEAVLTHVGDPEQTRARIEREAERIAEPRCEHEARRPAALDEGIRRRRLAVERETQHLALEAAEVARVGIRRVAWTSPVPASGVADADVENPVWPNAEAAAVVVTAVGPHPAEELGQAARIRAIAGHDHADDTVPPPGGGSLTAAADVPDGRLRVIEVEPSAAREVGR